MKFRLAKNTAPKGGLGKGNNGDPGSMRPLAKTTRLVSFDAAAEGKKVVLRRHPDWVEHQVSWRRLMDSLEGGDRYRNAVYGYDRRGLPIRMLLRHQKEYPDPQRNPEYYAGGYPGAINALVGEAGGVVQGMGPFPGQIGADPAATAMDDPYEMRRARTVVPEWTAQASGTHLAKIYDQEVDRDPDTCPPDLIEWWKDVDGAGTTIDDYMRETVGPLLGTLGTLDVCCDHPPAPPGYKIATRADELLYGMDLVVLSYFLPQNVVWWSNDHAGRFIEVLVREYSDPSTRFDHDKKGNAIDPEGQGDQSEKWRQDYVRWRLWRGDESILYNFSGDEVIDRKPHSYGRVPIIRLKAQKKHRTIMVGKSFYEEVAGLQRAFYNLDSELVLSDTLQASPLLSGPADLLKGDNTVPVGISFVLPKPKNQDTGGYESWEYVSPPSDPSDTLRKDKEDFRAAADRAACLSKPAGAETPGTVGQSGLSKQMDSHTGHKMLTAIAKSLAKAEVFIAELALVVIRGRDLTPEETAAIVIGYPSKFDIQDAQALICNTTALQLVMSSCGNAPMTEQMLISAAVRQLLLGLDDDEYDALDDEIEILVQSKALIAEQVHEMKQSMIQDASSQTGKGGESEDDPSGQSGGTSLGDTIATVA